MKYLEQTNPWRQKADLWLPGTTYCEELEIRTDCLKNTRSPFMLWNYTVVMVIQCTKWYWNAYFKFYRMWIISQKKGKKIPWGHHIGSSVVCNDLIHWESCSVQFSSVTQSCWTLCDPMNRSTPGLPVHHQLPEFTQTHVHWVSDTIQPSHPLSSPSPPAPNPSQHQSLFQRVNSSHEVAKVLEFQHQSFRWTSRTDLL